MRAATIPNSASHDEPLPHGPASPMSIRAVALEYIRNGWRPIPVPLREKGPRLKNWQRLRAEEADVARLFKNGQNVGLLLGEPSGGLVDVDLDSPEAVTLASSFLPITERIHGRSSSPASHRWYRTKPVALPEKFSDPTGACLVELRSTGQQTLAPPSIHPSGEVVEWESEGEASEVKASELRRGVSRLAAATLLVRSWPSEGGRHEFVLAVAGLLLRSAWSLEEARNFIWLVAKAAGDEEWRARGRDVDSTAKRLAANGSATGAKRLNQLLGKEIVNRICQWLDLQPVKDKPVERCGIQHTTDLGNARRFVARHGGDIRYCHLWHKWMVWDGTRWCIDETGEIERRAKETVRAIYEEAAGAKDSGRRATLGKWAALSESEARLRAMVSLAKSEPGVPVIPSELDTDAWQLNCANGTVDLRTGELRPHRREDLCTKLAPVNYDPEAKFPLWLGFLTEIMGNRKPLVDFLQRALGYSLTGDIREQVFFILYGTGANGKSTLTETFKSALGDYGSQAEFGTFLARKTDAIRNDLARLAGARFVSASEAEAGRRLSEELVKTVTGGEAVPARFLYGEFFEFRPQFKLFLATNHKPIIKGTDTAIWRRIRLVPFTVTIPLEQQDRELPGKLHAELPGILTWAVQGCLAWQEQGLDAPQDVVTATKDYREEMDLLAAFLEECCVQTSEATVPAGRLYERYKKWCDDNGESPLNQQTFGMRLSERDFKSVRTGRVRSRRGICLCDGGD